MFLKCPIAGTSVGLTVGEDEDGDGDVEELCGVVVAVVLTVPVAEIVVVLVDDEVVVFVDGDGVIVVLVDEVLTDEGVAVFVDEEVVVLTDDEVVVSADVDVVVLVDMVVLVDVEVVVLADDEVVVLADDEVVVLAGDDVLVLVELVEEAWREVVLVVVGEWLGGGGAALMPDGLMLRALAKQFCPSAPLTWRTPRPHLAYPWTAAEPHWFGHASMLPSLHTRVNSCLLHVAGAGVAETHRVRMPSPVN